MTDLDLKANIRELDYNYELYQKLISDLDKEVIEKYYSKEAYESRRRRGSENTIPSTYSLRVDLGPCPFEGNLKTAKVVLLLANPHADALTTPEDHMPIGDGWGVWGLSLSASDGMRNWWRPRLNGLITNSSDETEWKSLSNKVASFQAVAWASEQFSDSEKLRSKELMRLSLQHLIEIDPHKIYIVMRQKGYWEKVLPPEIKDRVLLIKNPRCSYITEKNLIGTDSWRLLVEALQA